jgi:hypothetical protein
MDKFVENCPAEYLYTDGKCQGPCPPGSTRIGDQCETNGKYTPLPKTFLNAKQLEEWKRTQTPLNAAITVMLNVKSSYEYAVLQYNRFKREADKLKMTELKTKYEIAKRYVLDEMSKTVIPLPPDEWANWQASLEFDMNKPSDFKGIANPYYTNYTFLRTLTRVPLMEVEFIKASNFVKGPVWPLIPRIGEYNHSRDSEYLTIANEIRNVSHEF